MNHGYWTTLCVDTGCHLICQVITQLMLCCNWYVGITMTRNQCDPPRHSFKKPMLTRSWDLYPMTNARVCEFEMMEKREKREEEEKFDTHLHTPTPTYRQIFSGLILFSVISQENIQKREFMWVYVCVYDPSCVRVPLCDYSATSHCLKRRP